MNIARPMFSRDPRVQGGFMITLFTFIFATFSDTEKFKRRLESLAISHVRRGVKCIEYGIIGEVSEGHGVALCILLSTAASFLPLPVKSPLNCVL